MSSKEPVAALDGRFSTPGAQLACLLVRLLAGRPPCSEYAGVPTSLTQGCSGYGRKRCWDLGTRDRVASIRTHGPDQMTLVCT